MKNSDKLLLVGFFTALLLITALHVTLYAKYKAGNYTVYNAEAHQIPESMQSFPNILFVSVRNVPEASIRFSNEAQVEKEEDRSIHYVRRGDTLLISGRDSSDYRSSGFPVELQLPHNATLSVFNSFVSFDVDKKMPASNPVIYLSRSQAFFSGDKSPLQLGSVKVVASDSSSVSFQGNTQINNLDIRLSNSTIIYTQGSFGQLSIVTDSVSNIFLQSKHLLKANIKTLPQ
jgi:hypothetical protein